jgi:hypothetical protein
MRKITGVIGDQSVLMICLNQIRTKIGVMHGDPTTVPGGMAIPFHSSVRLKLGAGSQIQNKNGDIVGINVSAKGRTAGVVSSPSSQKGRSAGRGNSSAINPTQSSGAGAVVTKSSSLKPREGNPGPTIAELPVGLLNAIGLASPGIREMKDEISEARRSGVPVIVSVFGFSVTDYSKSAGIAETHGADAVELNVSCPHVKKLDQRLGRVPV